MPASLKSVNNEIHSLKNSSIMNYPIRIQCNIPIRVVSSWKSFEQECLWCHAQRFAEKSLLLNNSIEWMLPTESYHINKELTNQFRKKKNITMSRLLNWLPLAQARYFTACLWFKGSLRSFWTCFSQDRQKISPKSVPSTKTATVGCQVTDRIFVVQLHGTSFKRRFCS